uniref:Uncharacterized protein n=1 Tax=Anopheles albimanus TaxID=7167 RepID=A0A182FWZ5_ANOAL
MDGNGKHLLLLLTLSLFYESLTSKSVSYSFSLISTFLLLQMIRIHQLIVTSHSRVIFQRCWLLVGSTLRGHSP